MVKRVFFSLCLLTMLVVGLPTPTYANEPVQTFSYVPIEPLWTHTVSAVAGLEITNGRALMSGSVIGRPGTERISVNARLERINPNGSFAHIGTWNNLSATGTIWVWERPHYVARGHDYRLTLTATVFRNGTSEIVSISRTTRAN
ncbi:MAG: hypothetical protein FWB96_10605 [Defluviitaleaceae bacterium]|nr:hypothetical protein [Defluviitaleaceae bacterium]MCL2263338.1 hypothetical protein [Defluviitaleaceae bacterium]